MGGGVERCWPTPFIAKGLKIEALATGWNYAHRKVLLTVTTRPHAFVAMPFGVKPGPDGQLLDFNRVYEEYIAQHWTQPD